MPVHVELPCATSPIMSHVRSTCLLLSAAFALLGAVCSCSGQPSTNSCSSVDGGTNYCPGTGGAPSTGGAPATGGAAGTGGSSGFSIASLFGNVPGTITLSATINKTDNKCVVVHGSTGCLAQNDPPCTVTGETTTVSLKLTLAADSSVTVQAPYQDMCTSDYVGSVVTASGQPTGEAVATSYPVPLPSTTWYYTPRSTDYCRVDASGQDTLVVDKVSTFVSGTTLTITQLCTTHFTVLDYYTSVPTALTDTRNWTTTIKLQ